MKPIQFSRVEPPFWRDKPIAVVAAGRSLDGFDFERLRGIAYVIAVKGMIFDIPWADAGTGIDAPRYQEWQDRFADVEFPIYWAASGMHQFRHHDHVKFLKRLENDGMTTDLGSLTGGGTSGYGAVNLACHKLGWKPGRIALFGFDYRGTDGHYNEAHYTKPRRQNASNWQGWAKRFKQMVPILNSNGIAVVNASSNSEIDAFPKMTTDLAIEWLKEERREATWTTGYSA